MASPGSQDQEAWPFTSMAVCKACCMVERHGSDHLLAVGTHQPVLQTGCLSENERVPSALTAASPCKYFHAGVLATVT